MEKHKIINLDLDGVVCNYNNTFRRYVGEMMGVPEGELMTQFPEPVDYDFVKAGWFETRKIFERAHGAAVDKGMFTDMEVFGGAVKALNSIQQSGVEIRVVTSRFVVSHKYSVAIADTSKFLDHHLIPYDEICFAKHKSDIRSTIAIDDSPHNIDEYIGVNQNVVVFSQEYNKQYVPQYSGNIILRSNDWDDIKECIIMNVSDITRD